MLREQFSKRCNLITSQNSENGVPVQAGVQLTVIREGNFWTSELCPFGGVEAQCGHQRRPKEHFERVPKQSTVNMRISMSLPHPPGGGGGRHLSCIRGAQLKAQNTKEISIEMP